MFRFEELRVYQESLAFIDNIYRLTDSWPNSEVFGLTSQARRSAGSVALNIAVGSSRTRKDFRHFLDMSRGSCFETVVILQIAKSRSYNSDQEFIENYAACESLVRMIHALKASLGSDIRGKVANN